MRGDQTPEQDAERERLRDKYRELKTQLNAKTTEDDLLAVDIAADNLWAKE